MNIQRALSITTLLALLTALISFAVSSYYRSNRTKFAVDAAVEVDRFLANHKPRKMLDLTSVSLEQMQLDTALPQSTKYPYEELVQLKKYATDCATLAPNPSQFLQKAWDWHRYLCVEGATLPDNFFANSPFIHPAGTSYVSAAWRTGRHEFNEEWLGRNAQFAHVSELRKYPSGIELADPLATLRGIPLSSLRAIERGLTIVQDDVAVWVLELQRESANKYRIYDRRVWDTYFARFGVVGRVTFDKQECRLFAKDFCWIDSTRLVVAQWVSRISFIVLLLSLLSLVGNFLYQQRRTRERMRNERDVMVSILTHELRTPVSAMKLSVESLRSELDQLPPNSQTATLRIIGDIAKLTRVVKSSEIYLKSESSPHPSSRGLGSVRLDEMLSEVLQKFVGQVIVKRPLPSVTVHASSHWIELCVENVIENALQHGRKPILVELIDSRESAEITVTDQGTVESNLKELLKRPFTKGSGSHGMGLGLYVVNQLMKAMGGSLMIVRDPTRVSLRWPH